MTWVYVSLFIFSWGLSVLFIPIMIRLAHRLNFIDHPGHRKIHAKPHPLLGGAAIFFAFQITIWLGLFTMWILVKTDVGNSISFISVLSEQAKTHYPGVMSKFVELLMLLIGGLICFICGIYDDKYGTSPKVKFTVEIIAILLLITVGVKLDIFLSIPFLGALITIFWVVFITNAFNLLDNMDGLSAGVAAIALLFFIIVNYQLGQVFLVCIMLVLLGAILGFLPFNINPSRIFMGDAGSLFIGYTIGSLTVISTFYDSTSPTPLSIMKPLVIFAVPAFDTLSVMYIRLRRGLPIFQGDKNHFSHRLVAIGMSNRNAVNFIYLVTLCTGISATLLRYLPVYGGIVILAQVITIFAIIVLLERIRQ